MRKWIGLGRLFHVQTGDFHATHELDAGDIPLISCGAVNHGLVGYFDIASESCYTNMITVAYNGQPLTAKFHPYTFGAKDDVAVLVPRVQMQEATLNYVTAYLNTLQWRYSYGRKCFKKKLEKLQMFVPLVKDGDNLRLDETTIERAFARDYRQSLPPRATKGITTIPMLSWEGVGLEDLFWIRRGDFHSIAALDNGPHMTISRTAFDNGVVGYYQCPKQANLYPAGRITISTVSGDAFVQMNEFIATDNVIICEPKHRVRVTTLFFIVFLINYQKWRYGYGRQCYLEKIKKLRLFLPYTDNEKVDERVLAEIVEQAPYWNQVKTQFKKVSV